MKNIFKNICSNGCWIMEGMDMKENIHRGQFQIFTLFSGAEIFH